MTLSTTKVRGVPVPLANSAPTIVADLTGMRDEIVRRGNRMAETQSARGALASGDQWPGLEFYETDTKKTYLRRDAGFERVSQMRWTQLPPFGALGTGYPTNDIDPIFVSGYGRFAPLNASGAGTLAFPTPFPNACMYIGVTSIEGIAVNPVVSAGALSKDGATLVWSGGANATVRFLYFAIGY